MKIYILVEDHAKNDMKAEHGLSIYFEEDKKRFLFDTGQSDNFRANAEMLGIDIDSTDFIILSHGHYDHTGGLDYIKKPIVCHPDCFRPKYVNQEYIGAPECKEEKIFSRNPYQLTDKVFFLGEIPGDRRGLGHNERNEKDFLYDDSAVAIILPERIVLLAGCAHSGIVNIIMYARSLFGNKPIDIIGGLHMLDLSGDEIKTVIRQLKDLNIEKIFAGHCTGDRAISRLRSEFLFEQLFSGKVIEI